MSFCSTRIVALALCGLMLRAPSLLAQGKAVPDTDIPARGKRADSSPPPAALSLDDGLSVIAAALDARTRVSRQPDCSHLVHAIYVTAGYPYPYARSSDLYKGADDFQRVWRPQPGDLAVWRGHVGIVVNPAQGVFFSRLRTGPGIATYQDPYWKKRGQVRFYRYIKSDPEQ